MADIGYIALVLAFIASLYTIAAFLFGAGRRSDLLESARNGLIATCALASVSVAALLYAVVTHDFQIAYVASYTNRDLSPAYLISAFWAGNAGSLLFWAWMLIVLAVVVVLHKWNKNRELIPYASAIIMGVEAFFLFLLLFTANPFEKLPFTPADGRGLNPLLENPGMLIHPPTLLFGYLGFTIPFAFAIAALITNRLGDEWIVSVRRWTIIAWLSLLVGNVLGAWWAYVELGWGGYWAWDPVENAGLMPWLVATAFLHSVMMQRRRGMLKIWNMALIILAFSLSIFGTFLTRSGVLSSVHTFADTGMGPFFLGLLAVVLVGSFGLLWYRREELRSEAEMESLVSRESTFLLNNLLLVGATFAIFLGTVFPVISEAVRGDKISVGAPFFNQVNGPIFLAVIVLTGICSLIGWRRASKTNLLRNFLWPAVLSIVVSAGLFLIGVRQWLPLAAVFFCVFVVLTIFYELARGTRARSRMKAENYGKAFFGLIWANKPRYGGYIVHIGVVLIAIGVIGSSFFQVQSEAILKPGESMSLGKYTLTYEGMDNYVTESKSITSTTLSVTNSGEPIGKMVPLKYVTPTSEQPTTEVAIRSTPVEDLYVILVGWDADGSASFKVLVNPAVAGIWVGGIVLFFGGLIAFWPDRRERLPGG
ncbi:MAG: heme lyase CcmF/NrfE family subunit [Dehalococcoidia bacterium]|nr:heme lyase CcmF/NrfE family subunit [Dehalococcoidia bacterium]